MSIFGKGLLRTEEEGWKKRKERRRKRETGRQERGSEDVLLWSFGTHQWQQRQPWQSYFPSQRYVWTLILLRFLSGNPFISFFRAVRALLYKHVNCFILCGNAGHS